MSIWQLLNWTLVAGAATRGRLLLAALVALAPHALSGALIAVAAGEPVETPVRLMAFIPASFVISTLMLVLLALYPRQ